jgi:hypothetical protein
MRNTHAHEDYGSPWLAREACGILFKENCLLLANGRYAHYVCAWKP